MYQLVSSWLRFGSPKVLIAFLQLRINTIITGPATGPLQPLLLCSPALTSVGMGKLALSEMRPNCQPHLSIAPIHFFPILVYFSASQPSLCIRIT